MPLTTSLPAARDDGLACVDALESDHRDVARAKCGDAVAKDDGFALGHLWLAQSLSAPDAAAAEVRKAMERAGQASRGEQLFVVGWVAWKEGRLAEARRDYDELARMFPGEPRAFTARGQLRQAMGDLDGAVADFEAAVRADDKLGAARNLLGFALMAQGKIDPAFQAMHRYVELAPSEPSAHVSLAAISVRAGDLAAAVIEARRAAALDGKFLPAHATLGDALLFSGKLRDARHEYAMLEASDDPALRHDGAMRSSRSYLFEDKGALAERALILEGLAARKARRPLDSAEAFLEAARIQLERGALAEAGRGLSEASASLKTASDATGEPPVVDALARRQLAIAILEARARALALLHERSLAEVKAEELAAQLQALGNAHADDRLRALRGWMAQKNGDDTAALAGLDKAALPTERLVLAQMLVARGDKNRGHVILDELAHRTANDLETALTRSRARKALSID